MPIPHIVWQHQSLELSVQSSRDVKGRPAYYNDIMRLEYAAVCILLADSLGRLMEHYQQWYVVSVIASASSVSLLTVNGMIRQDVRSQDLIAEGWRQLFPVYENRVHVVFESPFVCLRLAENVVQSLAAHSV